MRLAISIIIFSIGGAFCCAKESVTDDRIDGYRLFYDLSAKQARVEGQVFAKRDFVAGQFRQLVYGLRSSSEMPYERYLKKRYSVAVYSIAGCIVSDGIVSAAEGYNVEMTRRLKAKFGKDVFAEARKQTANKVPPPVLSIELPHVSFKDAECSDVLDFFQSKAAELARGTAHPDEFVLALEYRFDAAKQRPLVNYEQRNVIFYDMFADVLQQLGLDYVTLTRNKLRIVDVSLHKKQGRLFAEPSGASQPATRLDFNPELERVPR
jgi:hypothetical protein